MAGRVLVVATDADFLEMLHLVLTGEGYTVLTCPVPEEARQRIDEFQPCVVIIDLVPRSVVGWDIVEQLASDPLTGGIRIIASVIAPPSQLPRSIALRAAALEQQGHHFLVKPFDVYDLLAVLAKIKSNCNASRN